MTGMKSHVVEEKDNPLMRRKEYWLSVTHPEHATPARKDVMAFLAAELKAKEDTIIIDKMFSDKGIASTRVKVEVYAKKEDIPKRKLEAAQQKLSGIKKGKKGEAAKPAQAAAKAETKST